MSTQPLLAVIVPVYKVEEYLRPCVDSILAQSYQALRVILVDDGSPDRCGEICQEYAERDPRVLVLHKENGGLSSARNYGLEAIGDASYITFVDSDDALLPGVYDRAIAHLEAYPEVDVVGYGMNKVSPQGVEAFYDAVGGAFGREEAMRELCHPFSYSLPPSAWTKVFRREAIGDVRFREGYNYEDTPFMLEVLRGVRRYDSLPFIGYSYVVSRAGAITATIDKKMAHLFDNLEDLQARHADDLELCLYANTLVVNYLWMYWYHLYRSAPEAYREVTGAFLPYLRRARRRPYLNLEGGRVHALKQWLFLQAPYLYTKLSLR